MTERVLAPPRFEVRVDGEALSAEEARALVCCSVDLALQVPAMAELRVADRALSLVDSARLDIGATLEVIAPGPAGPQAIFDGEVTEIEPDFGPNGMELVVRASDRLHRLTRDRRARSFVDVTDADVAEQLAREHGLEVDCPQAGLSLPYLLQLDETGLGLLQRRARVLGWQLRVEGRKIYFGPADPGDPVATLAWGETLREFRPRLSTLGAARRAVVRGWDPLRREEIESSKDDPGRRAPVGEKRSGSELTDAAFQVEPEVQGLGRPVRSRAEADALAATLAQVCGDRSLEAEGSCTGLPSLAPGRVVEVQGCGARFSGHYALTSVNHRYDHAGYVTSFSATGAWPRGLLDLISPPPPPNLTVLTAVVTDNADPDRLGRVRVRYPQLTAEHASPWARVVAPGAGPERGIAWLPEIGDEVLVALEMGDPDQPYVLGGLWNGKDAPPASDLVAGGKVARRVLRTRAGHEIVLDDQGAGSITVRSVGDLTLEARQKVRISGAQIDIG